MNAGIGDKQRRGGDEPLEVDQQRQQRHERQDAADQAERGLDHLHGSEGGFALDLLDQVVELRPLEEDQVELIGVAHHQELNAVRDLLLEQLLADVRGGAEDVADGADRRTASRPARPRSAAPAVPAPVLTAATTSSISSFETQTRAAGRKPWTRLSTARLTVSGALASQTSASTRRKPCQVVPRVGPQDAVATSAGRSSTGGGRRRGACRAVGVPVGQPDARRGGRAESSTAPPGRAGRPATSSLTGSSHAERKAVPITSGRSASAVPLVPLACCAAAPTPARTAAPSRPVPCPRAKRSWLLPRLSGTPARARHADRSSSGGQAVELDDDLVMGGRDRLDVGLVGAQPQTGQIHQVLGRLGQRAEAILELGDQARQLASSSMAEKRWYSRSRTGSSSTYSGGMKRVERQIERRPGAFERQRAPSRPGAPSAARPARRAAWCTGRSRRRRCGRSAPRRAGCRRRGSPGPSSRCAGPRPARSPRRSSSAAPGRSR